MIPLAGLALLAASSARAQTLTAPTATVAAPLVAVTAPPSATATVTVTDPLAARGLLVRERFEPEDAVLFLPRILLVAPRWAVAIVGWPIRQTLRLVEEYSVVEHLEDLLYNDARTAGVLPTLTGFPGAGLSGGARVFHNDLFGHEESVALSAAYGGLYTQAYRLTFGADHVGGGRLWFDSEVSYEAKPNLYFYGLGAPPEAEADVGLDPRAAAVQTRFAEQRVLGRVRMGTAHGRPGQVIRAGASFLYNHRRFDTGQRLSAGQLSTDQVYDVALIPSFLTGADTLEVTLDLELDFRDHPGRPTDGFYVEAFLGGVPPQGDWRYLHWGAEASVFFELWAPERVLVLRGFVEGVEGDAAAIPFADLPRLGGPYRLRGYRLNTFRDEKAILGTLEYRWHVHQFVTASLFVDAGQVNDDYLDLLKFGDDARWKVGFGGGLRIGSKTSTLLNVDISYGDQLQVLVSTEPLQAFAQRTKQL